MLSITKAQTRSFMAKLCRIATAAVFVVHMMVGCCAHHAHACEGQGLALPAQGVASADDHCSDGHSSPADHSHPAPDGCQGAKCSTVLSSELANNSFGHPSLASFVSALDDPSSQSGVFSAQRCVPIGRLLLPVRLHLANQVLLV
jgi:hypothetical protein